MEEYYPSPPLERVHTKRVPRAWALFSVPLFVFNSKRTIFTGHPVLCHSDHGRKQPR